MNHKVYQRLRSESLLPSRRLRDVFFPPLQESSNGPVKKSMREKAVERRGINKEHNSNFKAGYVPIEEERLHKTGLRGRKGNMAVCIVILLFILALINLIVSSADRPLGLEITGGESCCQFVLHSVTSASS